MSDRPDSHGTVLVTDGEQRAALAVVRSLSAAGFSCIVGSHGGRSLAGASRGAEEEIALPDPGTTPEAYANHVGQMVRKYSAVAVLPISEPSLLALLPHSDDIGAVIPFPDAETFKRICDKKAVLSAAREVGISVPEQHVLETPRSEIPSSITYPVVLKPHRSVFAAPDGTRAKVGVEWAYSESECRQKLLAYPTPAYPMLLQEAIRGPGVGVFVLLHEGEVTASFSHERIREKPPSGGVSVLRRSIPLESDLLDRSVKLLRRFNWSGVAMVEFKRDRDSSEPYLMEINGRFWGSLQLAIDAGVDFPALLLAATFGEAARGPESYAQVVSRWFWGDVDHLISSWRHPEPMSPAKARLIMNWLLGFRPSYRTEVFRWRDPAPFFRESRMWFRSIRSG